MHSKWSRRKIIVLQMKEIVPRRKEIVPRMKEIVPCREEMVLHKGNSPAKDFKVRFKLPANDIAAY